MVAYSPLYIKGMEVGLVQSRQEFILPDDAYPTLENAYVWRERIKRKQAYQLLGRLQRSISVSIVLTTNTGQTGQLPNFPVVPDSINLIGSSDGTTYTDPAKNGTLTASGGTGTGGTINYATGSITINAGGGETLTGTIQYYPALPVMGIRTRDQASGVNDQTVFFDTVYAYKYNSLTNVFQEFIPGTTWTGTDYEFFWTTNYWIDAVNIKIFWATNYSLSLDPIRYTNGSAWVDFAPIINNSGSKLQQCLALLPFRGRLVAFNTAEGTTLGNALRYTNRIRWAAIGTPFTVSTLPLPVNVNPNAWRDDIRGQGGFLDIPTNEDIVSVGFVRDNLVIYCESSTWQLRYTGRTIAPFQIEKVNSELGAFSTFSAVQFDTSLVGVGNRGIIECDSYKSDRIDIKIPDFVFHLQDNNHGERRIHGIRDFINRLAYWTYPSEEANGTFPDKRLVYNYENDSWAIFTDSLTTLGVFQETSSRTWLNTHIPWIQCNFNWINQPANNPVIVGGNQQGFIEQLDEQTTNDPSLYISAITGNSPNPTVVTSPAHNMQTGFVIKISGIPSGTPFATALNNNIYGIVVIDANNFKLFTYSSTTGEFSDPQLSSETDYIGSGVISVRDNFKITSKKFNFLDDGQNIQMGYLDILMNATEPTNPGSIALNIYLDYDDNETVNTPPQNVIASGSSVDVPDTFFNQIIPTTNSTLNTIEGSKFWHRAFCGVRGNFFTIQYTFNNTQMAGIEQELDVQIDSQILWIRRAGQINPGG